MAITDQTIAWKLAVAGNVDLLWGILGAVVIVIACYVIWHTESKLEKEFEDNCYGV